MTPSEQVMEYKLFVGNLPADISEEDMRTVFTTYGMVTDVHIMTGRSQSGAACAFVHYADQVSADQAIAALNKTYKIRIDAVDPITVSYAKVDTRASGSMTSAGSYAGSNAAAAGFNPMLQGALNPYGMYATDPYAVYAQALAHQPPAVAGHDFLNPLYNPLYNPAGMAMAGGKGPGGMNPKGPGAAGMAKGGGHNGMVHNQNLPMGAQVQNGMMQHNGMQQQAGGAAGAAGGGSYYGGGKGGGPRPGRNPHPNHPGRKIFVGNLPTDITKEVLRQVFSTYGVVTDVHVMVGKSDSGQACAFVEYQQQIEAQTAINTLNNNYEIREGCGKIVCRFYEKPEHGQGGHRGAKGGFGKGIKGSGKYAGGKHMNYLQGTGSAMPDQTYNKAAQAQHSAFLSGAQSPTKAQDANEQPVQLKMSSTPNTSNGAVTTATDAEFLNSRCAASSPKPAATKSTTGSPGEEGMSTSSPVRLGATAIA
ncbi:unnamed protein product [Amoebophrya sp. A120]|nr:unnamed protein product [Amoebophrya sp. A120]|eukprot:GSA120T00021525001.1